MLGAFLNNSSQTGRQPSWPSLLFGAFIMLLLIGLRYDVGADWQRYEFLFARTGHADFGRQLRIGDPGYLAVSWAVHQLSMGFWAVNLICATIFTWGLLRFATVQADPWLALVVAMTCGRCAGHAAGSS
jgi:hypothetical protein